MSSSLQDLNPVFRPIAERILAECTDRLESDYGGSSIRPAVTFRQLAEQAAAKAAGLSDVALGWHQFGLAMDAAIIDPGGQYVTDGSDPRYAVFGMIAKTYGCIWGGDWTHRDKGPDWDHIEYHPGFTMTQYLAWMDSHRVVTA